jgi:hypothetical protein
MGDLDFFKLSGWFAYSEIDQPLYYWDATQVMDYHYCVKPNALPTTVRTDHLTPEEHDSWLHSTRWGYGFSYVYRRAVWQTVPFNPHVVGWNDYCFARDVIQQGFEVVSAPDEVGLAIHIIHTNNVSWVAPQYHLPPTALYEVFGEKGWAYLQHYPVAA